MKFKMIMVIVDESRTRALLKAAREAGATGSTVISSVRGEGSKKSFGILGLEISEIRDVLLFVVEEHRAKQVLERLAEIGEFDETPGTGIAVQLDVEDALGVRHQMQSLADKVKEQI